MKLWMSAEIDADVDEKNEISRKLIVAKVNEKLNGQEFAGPWKSWDFIIMIMSDRDAYKEVAKRSKKDWSLEFRLKVDHGKFLKASQPKANQMVIEALGRSLDKMVELEVPAADVKILRDVLSQVAKEV